MHLHLLLLSFFVCPLLHAAEIAVRIESTDPGNQRVKVVGGNSVFIAEGGPVELRFVPAAAIDPQATVLEFEVFSLGGCKNVSAKLSLPSGLERERALPEIGHSEAWTTYTAPLVPKDAPSPYWKSLTLNLPLAPTATLNIRKVRLVTPGAGKSPSADEAAVELRDQLIQKYLETTSDARIE